MAVKRTGSNVPLALRPYIVAAALPLVVDMLRRDGVRLAFSSRTGRTLGYYKPPVLCSLHTISLQVNLNPYALLFVFVHEWAHLLTQKQYGNEVYPHGKEWKKNFKTLFRPFFRADIFPEDILGVIAEYFNKTSRYFEKELEDACNRYGKDRKAFYETYMRLLAQGVVIPAPYMGMAAQKRLDDLRQNREKNGSEAETDLSKTNTVQNKAKEIWMPAGRSAIASIGKGERIRMEGTEYEVEENLSPFVIVRHIGDGHQLHVHGLVEVERLVPDSGQV